MLFVWSYTVSQEYVPSINDYVATEVKDIWSFPLSKTANANGQVIVTLTDITSIRDTIAQDLADRGYPEFQWSSSPQRFTSFRNIIILGCPLILKLNDHTDFSSLNWQWTP